MKNLAVIYDEAHSRHSPPYSHPEKPERTISSYKYLKEKNFFNTVDLLKPTQAVKEDILRVHTDYHYNFIVESIDFGRTQLDEDTYIVKDSLKPSLLSAGAAVNAVDLVMNGTYRSVFSLMRPPGHHAESNKPMGFCLFNNAAIGAKYALEKYNLQRIAVIDWDVHHGNGTQEIFYYTNQVFYISLHQYPFYPGTGAANERGAGSGKGFTLNFPLPAGTTGETYIRIFNDDLTKALDEYNPQLIFISAGFDAHKDDPLANMNLTEKDFAELTRIVKQFAGAKNINIISLLEGGYNLDAISKSIFEHLQVLNENL